MNKNLKYLMSPFAARGLLLQLEAVEKGEWLSSVLFVTFSFPRPLSLALHPLSCSLDAVSE